MNVTPETHMEMDEFSRGYLAAALWTSHDDSGEYLDDNYGVGDIHPESLREAREDCAVFQRIMNLPLWQAGTVFSRDQLGHDFWLTRNGHGVGYWDRPELSRELREKLTKASRFFGMVDLYVGDDGLLHFSQ